MGQSFYDLLKDAAFAGGGGGSPAPAPVLIEKSISQNGTYNASTDNADGYSAVTVDVEGGAATLITKSVTANGTYAASSDNADGYSSVSVEVEPNLTTKSITANGTYNATSDNADGYSSVTVNVPNTYSASDEGKVVSNGALVAQSSDTVTENGTVDTTLISSLLVNVAGGSSGTVVKLTLPASSDITGEFYIFEGDYYIYCYGYFTGGNEVVLSIPQDFDVNKIDREFKSVYKSSSNGSPTITLNKTNRNISITAGSGTVPRIVMVAYSKASS